MEDDAARPEPGGVEPETESPDTPVEEPLPEPPTQEQIDKAERLIREAMVARRRGDKLQASKLLDQAVEVAPGSATVLEAVGDDLRERRQTRAARDMYARALRVDPKNIVIERKFAECVLTTEQMSFEYVAAREEIDAASGKVALILSILIPGLGQIVTGHRNRGIAMLVGWLIGWTVALLIPNGVKGILKLFGGAGGDFNGVVLLPLAVAAFCHLWAIYDAAARAQGATRQKVERPRPPVDKDFEL